MKGPEPTGFELVNVSGFFTFFQTCFGMMQTFDSSCCSTVVFTVLKLKVTVYLPWVVMLLIWPLVIRPERSTL